MQHSEKLPINNKNYLKWNLELKGIFIFFLQLSHIKAVSAIKKIKLYATKILDIIIVNKEVPLTIYYPNRKGLQTGGKNVIFSISHPRVFFVGNECK